MEKTKRRIQSLVTKMIGKLDNIGLRRKFYYIYIFCVIIPVIATNSVVIGILVRAEQKQKRQMMDNIAEAVEYVITNTVDSAISVTRELYTNKYIYRFLAEQYAGPLEYWTAYENLNQNYVLRAMATQKVTSLTIYADNKTIVNGKEFAQIETIQNTEWYRALKESDTDLVLYAYYDEAARLLSTADYPRKVSVIRKINFYDKDSEKLVKVDLDYYGIIRDLSGAQYAGKVYVCDGDTIIFTNQEGHSKTNPFVQIDNEVKDKAHAIRQMKLYGQNWTIYIVGGKSNIGTIVFSQKWLIFSLVLLNILIPIIVIYCVNQSMTARMLRLGRHLSMVKDETFEEIQTPFGADEIGNLIQNYNLMVLKMKELIQVVYKGKMERQELNLAKQRAELLALHSQINPHFMFNALESIRMRSVLKQEEETAEIIGKLAILMRKSTDWGQDEITVKEEIEFAEAYLKLQQYRFGERLSYKIHVAEDCMYVRIPKLTIVTFVENSCVHGVEGMSRNGWIMVNVYQEKEQMIIEIEDTGIGMNEDYVAKLCCRIRMAGEEGIEGIEQSDSVGMLNVFIRLTMYFQRKIEFEIVSEENVGTVVAMKLPLDC